MILHPENNCSEINLTQDDSQRVFGKFTLVNIQIEDKILHSENSQTESINRQRKNDDIPYHPENIELKAVHLDQENNLSEHETLYQGIITSVLNETIFHKQCHFKTWTQPAESSYPEVFFSG